MAIFGLQDINSLMKSETDFKNHFDKVSHIQKCYGSILNKRLFDYFGRNYLFHTVYYLDENKKFHNINIDIPLKKQKNQIISYINQGAQQIVSGKQISSFTELMCQEKKQVLCLYKSKIALRKSKSSDSFLYQDITCNKVISNICTFFKQDKLFIEYLIDCYKNIIASVNPSNCFVYFIRPFTMFENYNGVFSIILKRKLTDSEIIELGSVWTKILSDTSIIEIVKQAKNNEQEFIFEEHTHTWNSEITSINQHLNVIDSRFKNDPQMDYQAIRSHINFALNKSTVLRTIIQFNLFLMKTRGYLKWNDVDKQNFSTENKNLLNTNKIETISIKELLNKALFTVENIVLSYGEKDNNFIKKNALIDKIIKSIQTKVEDINIDVIPTGAYIIFLDLIKNAVFHIREDEGFIEVCSKKERKKYHLSFTNDGLLSDELINFINLKLGEINFTKQDRRHGGIRIIKRILECPLFTTFSKEWKIKAFNDKTKQTTTISLTIPIE